MMGSVREAESLCDTGSLLAFGEGRRLGNCFLRKSEKQRSCLFPDYEESAQESTLTLIENGWNNLAERGIINRDTAAVNHVDERKRCTAVRRDKTALFQRIAQEFVHRMYMEMFCSEFG